MNLGSRAKQRWDTVHLSGYGALLGFLGAIIEQFCHAFCPASWGHEPGGNLFVHILLEILIGASAGAAVFAAISAIRNWLVQEGYFR